LGFVINANLHPVVKSVNSDQIAKRDKLVNATKSYGIVFGT